MVLLGVQLFESDKERSFEFLRRAAADGEHTAQLLVGVASLWGISKVTDENGVKLISESSKRGDVFATIFLAELYLRGERVKRDRDAASELLKGVGDSNRYAQYLLALLHFDKETPDFESGLRFARLSSGQGFSQAHLLLAKIYSEGKGPIVPDPELAFSYYNKVSDKLGFAYLFNEALSAEAQGDMDRCLSLLRRATEGGLAEASNRLCNLLLRHSLEQIQDESTEEEKEALLLAEKGAASGCLESKVILGWIYWNGLGRAAPKNLEKAMNFFLEAAQSGDNRYVSPFNGYNTCFRARFILGCILAAIPGRYEEARQYFRAASTELPVAKYTLGCISLMTADIFRAKGETVTTSASERKASIEEGWGNLTDAIYYRVSPAIALVKGMKAQLDKAKKAGQQPKRVVLIQMQAPLDQGVTAFIPFGMKLAQFVALGQPDSGFYDLKTENTTIEKIFRFAKSQHELSKNSEDPEPQKTQNPTRTATEGTQQSSKRSSDCTLF